MKIGGFLISDCRMPIADLFQLAIGIRKLAITNMASLTYTQLLQRNRSFRRLWIGQVVSELGNWFNFIAGLGLVRVVSKADPAVTAMLLMCSLLAFTVFGLIAGSFVYSSVSR